MNVSLEELASGAALTPFGYSMPGLGITVMLEMTVWHRVRRDVSEPARSLEVKGFSEPVPYQATLQLTLEEPIYAEFDPIVLPIGGGLFTASTAVDLDIDLPRFYTGQAPLRGLVQIFRTLEDEEIYAAEHFFSARSNRRVPVARSVETIKALYLPFPDPVLQWNHVMALKQYDTELLAGVRPFGENAHFSAMETDDSSEDNEGMAHLDYDMQDL